MLGMFTKRQNVARLQRLSDRVRALERKGRRTPAENDELDDARVAAAELQRWLDDLQRIEG